ncbi:MAG: aldo/keto reductase [Planctomycetota bacterium]|nr:MAG: aldo/keto reductase [Planctomycetota bacterium]
MELRLLGRTGLKVPRLVFGATSLGNLFRALPAEEKAAIVEAWMQSPWRPVVIDSAGKYGAGMSLEVIGQQLARLEVDPEEVLISNKLGWRRVPLSGDQPSFEPDAWFELEWDAVQDISYDGILRCWEEGNRLLGSYPAHLVSVHDPDDYLDQATDAEDRERRLRDIVEAYRGLEELRDRGAARAVGVGAKNWKVIEELSHLCRFDWVMFANSFTIMHHPPELARFMQQLSDQGVGILNSALFHGGFLLGGDLFDYRKIDPTDPRDVERLAWRERFWECCRQVGKSPFEIGVAFGLAHPAVTAVALSSSRPDRIPQQIAAVEQKMSTDVWRVFQQAGLVAEVAWLDD